jgi:hypothetical protein
VKLDESRGFDLTINVPRVSGRDSVRWRPDSHVKG